MPRRVLGSRREWRPCWSPATGALPSGPLLRTGPIQPHPGIRRSRREGAAPSSQGSPGGLVPARGTVRMPRPALDPEGPRLSGTQHRQSEESGVSTDPWRDCADQLWAGQDCSRVGPRLDALQL